LNTSRSGYARCGAQQAHSSSVTSLGYPARLIRPA
jgi:hypothetical protein